MPTGPDPRPPLNAPIRTWRWESDYGAEAPADVDRDLVIDAWLHANEGMTIDQLDADEVERLRSGMRFHVLYSVVKRDHDYIDPDDCGGFHSEGSGKRTKETWFLDGDVFNALIDGWLDRHKEASCG